MEQILVIADLPGGEQTAINRAVQLSKFKNKPLHIVFFCYQNLRHLNTDAEEVKQAVIDSVTSDAKLSLKVLVPKDVECTFEVVWEKHIHGWVCDYADKHHPSFVVKTAHRSETIFYTPTDWHLLRECEAPIYLVSDEKWRKTPNVLAAIDLETSNQSKQDLNHEILRRASIFTEENNTELHVCYTLSFSTMLRDLGMQYQDELEIKAETRLEPILKELSEKYDIPLSHFHIKAGKPELVIPSTAANCKTGLVVIGTVGRQGLKAKVIGNTAESILSLLKTDVLALKPE